MSDPIIEAIQAERLRIRAGQKPRRQVAPLFDELHERMGAALAYRLGGPAPDNDEAIQYVGANFGEMVSTLLRARGIGWESRSEMFSRGITTSDVTALLQGAGNRLLRAAYESYSGGLLRLCGRVRSRDFRDVRSIQVDGDAALQEVREGVFTEGSLKATADTYPISTFGRLLGWNPTLFSEDDLGVFANLGAQLGRMAAEFVSGKVAAVLESNPTLSDGVAVFASGHANLGAGGAISETTIGELLKLLRNQTGLGGERISAVPRALVVPSALEFAANKVVAVMGNPRPIEVVVEPGLSSATAHYVLADPTALAAITYTYPAGSDGPTIEVGRRPGFHGLAAKVILDFGAGWADHRGAAKNVGA